jgi:WD40 repeat protein
MTQNRELAEIDEVIVREQFDELAPLIVRYVASFIKFYFEETDQLPEPEAGVLWGSSSGGSINPGSVYTINPNTGSATFVGSTEVVGGRDVPEVSGIAFDPTTGTMYGITGSACSGAILITINPTTGVGTVVGPLVGPGFDGTLTQRCEGGSDSLTFAADGTLYAGGWNGGTTIGGKLMKIDKDTGQVLELLQTPDGAHLAGLAFDPSGTLWASRGGNIEGSIHTVDPSTGAFTSTLVLSDLATVSDLAFFPDGTLFASLPSENVLAMINVTTGIITRIGSFGETVSRMSGLAFR